MQIYNIIGNVLGVDPATLNEQSDAQTTPRWDSLRHIEVIFAVESAFHIRFTMPEIANLRNLGDIRNLLVAKNVRFTDGINQQQKRQNVA